MLFDPGEPVYEFGSPKATLTLCWAAAIALVYVGEGYGAYEVDGRGDRRTCFCGDLNNKKKIATIVVNLFYYLYFSLFENETRLEHSIKNL